MARKKIIELEAGKPVLGVRGQKEVERILKKAAEKAAKDAKRKWKSTGRNAFAKHARNTIGDFRDALKSALNFHANNSGPRPSIKMTAPDTGGRPFHFSHTTVSASGASSTYRAGTTVAHMAYIERVSAVEQAILEEGVDPTLSSREIEEDAFGRDLADMMQSYIEDAQKVEAAKAATPGQASAQPLAFSFGNIGETREDRREFWLLVEKHRKNGKARLQNRVILELPFESTPSQRLDIVKRYTDGLEKRGLRFHAALHAPTDKNDPRNFHAHVIYYARPAKKIDFAFDGLDDGTDKPKRKIWDFAAVTKINDEHDNKRTRYLYRSPVDPYTRSKKFIPEERKRLAEIVNDVMHEAGNPVRYDPRSYKAMGIEVEAMRSISRIVADKAKAGKRLILDEGRTKRDIEAEVQRLARERAPEFSEISKVRAAVRAGDQELRQLEKEGAFLKGKPIVRRGVHAVRTFVKRKALDYARTRALHVERSIEAAQELRSVERLVEATNPEVVAQLRSRLAESLVKARQDRNPREVARLKKELKVIPKTAQAGVLNGVARQEANALKARQERHAATRLAKVNLALRDWRQAAIGAKAQPLTTATPMAVATGGLARDPAQARAPEPKLPKHSENPMWATYDQIVDATFKTGFQRYMWGVAKRYSQFILDNAEPDVPGNSPIELAHKLVEALKQHPIQADAVILSHQNGREVPQPGQPQRAARTNVIRVEGGTPAPVADAPVVFKQPGRIPRPAPGRVEPFPYELTPLDPVPAKTPAKPAPADIHTPELPESILRETDPIPYKKDSEKRRKRRRGFSRPADRGSFDRS